MKFAEEHSVTPQCSWEKCLRADETEANLLPAVRMV